MDGVVTSSSSDFLLLIYVATVVISACDQDSVLLLPQTKPQKYSGIYNFLSDTKVVTVGSDANESLCGQPYHGSCVAIF